MLTFGKITIGSRAEVERLESERDEWQMRAEVLARMVRERTPAPKRRTWPAVLATVWVLLAGVFLGGAVIPHKNDAPVLAQNLPACIGQARYAHPVEGNQYQELVNALYACDVYGGDA